MLGALELKAGSGFESSAVDSFKEGNPRELLARGQLCRWCPGLVTLLYPSGVGPEKEGQKLHSRNGISFI